MSANDAGPAFAGFPDQKVVRDGKEQMISGAPGMSLRDYFAAQAMMGMQARDMYDAGQVTPQQRASLAYIEADAMLAERAKAPGAV